MNLRMISSRNCPVKICFKNFFILSPNKIKIDNEQQLEKLIEFAKLRVNTINEIIDEIQSIPDQG